MKHLVELPHGSDMLRKCKIIQNKTDGTVRFVYIKVYVYNIKLKHNVKIKNCLAYNGVSFLTPFSMKQRQTLNALIFLSMSPHFYAGELFLWFIYQVLYPVHNNPISQVSPW